MISQDIYINYNVPWASFWFLVVTKAQVLLIPMKAYFLNQRKRYRLKREDTIYPLALWGLQTQVRCPWSWERENGSKETVKAFSQGSSLDPGLGGDVLCSRSWTRRAKLAQRWPTGRGWPCIQQIFGEVPQLSQQSRADVSESLAWLTLQIWLYSGSI